MGEERWQSFQAKMKLLEECRSTVAQTRAGNVTLSQLLRRPDFTQTQLPTQIRAIAPSQIWDLVETEIKYHGYATRQAEQNRQIAKRYLQKIPDGIDFERITALSSETRQKLGRVRPASLGQAANISGVTPADIAILSIWLNKKHLDSKPGSCLSAQSIN